VVFTGCLGLIFLYSLSYLVSDLSGISRKSMNVSMNRLNFRRKEEVSSKKYYKIKLFQIPNFVIEAE
jgi:hypothetical protein